MNRWRICWVCVLLSGLMLVGCDDDGGSESDAVSDLVDSDMADADVSDLRMDEDMSADVDALDDADADVSDGTDQADADMPPPACDYPSPRFGTGDVVDSPGHCGLDFQWVDPASMGDLAEFGSEQTFAAGVLNAVLVGAGIDVPTPPEHDVTVRQFTYLTQDRGVRLEASAVVAYPNTLTTDEPVPVIAILHGTSGFNDECAPSNTPENLALPAFFASLGYIAVAPDYIGLKGLGEPTGFKHPYLVGQPTAIASLDSIRAVGKLGPDELGGLCPSSRTVVMGGSQGGHAALWVDRLAPYYAPEIELAGMVATVPPADLVGEVDRALTQFVNATGNTTAFYGSSAEWYGLEDRLDEMFLSPYDVDVPQALATSCSPQDAITDPIETLDDAFTTTFLDAVAMNGISNVEPWGCMTSHNGLTTTPVARLEQPADEYAILWVLSENDELVHTPTERISFDTLCDEGMPLQYLECAGAGHVDSTIWSLPEILAFLEARVAGEVPDAGDLCNRGGAVTCSGTP